MTVTSIGDSPRSERGGSPAERLFRLFEGASRSHGTYGATYGEGVKVEIKASARTVKEPVTVALWEKHLAGERPLGIVAIREDDTCMWGAVDIDEYTNLDHKKVATVLEEMSIPAVPCRTKSGGLHVFLFFSEGVPARLVMYQLRELAAMLGYGGSEIFPKQETVLAERGDLGSWLNMPYESGDRGKRYAIRPDGRGMSLEDFLDHAESLRITEAQLRALPLRRKVEEFSNGPPCLEILVGKGIDESRNNALMALTVLAKKVRPDDWEPLVRQWNQEHIKPPLSDDEVGQVIKSNRRKNYNYRCGDTPIVSHCNAALCRTRLHGVGSGGEASLLEAVSILTTDPPIFFVVLKTGQTVEATAGQMMSAREFQSATLSQVQVVLPIYSPATWVSMIKNLVENATRVDAPSESGIRGRFREIFETFVTDRYRAESSDELIVNKPWRDTENGRVYFRLTALEDAANRAKFQPPERREIRSWITQRIREMGGKSETYTVRGRGVKVWSVPDDQFSWNVVRLNLPTADESPL